MKVSVPDPQGIIIFYSREMQNSHFSKDRFSRFIKGMDKRIEKILGSNVIKEITYFGFNFVVYDGDENIGHASTGYYLPACPEGFDFAKEFKNYYKKEFERAEKKFNLEESRSLDVLISITGARECGIQEVNALDPFSEKNP